MARERSYRRDVRCRHCGSNWMPKDGRARGQRLYKRGECKRKQVADAAQPHFPEHVESVWVWTAVVEERDGSRWMDFEIGGRDEAALLRLLERLRDAERYETDGYSVYEWPPRNKHVIGKCGAVNWNEGSHSMLRGKLNRLAPRTKSCAKSVEIPVNLLVPAFAHKLKFNTT